MEWDQWFELAGGEIEQRRPGFKRCEGTISGRKDGYASLSASLEDLNNFGGLKVAEEGVEWACSHSK